MTGEYIEQSSVSFKKLIFFSCACSVKLTNTPDGTVKLEIEHAKPSDCGAYKLVISNPNGESSALCAVAVKRKPFLFVIPSSGLFI